MFDKRAGALTAGGARGGPDVLATQPFEFGGNDPLGCDPGGQNCSGSNAAFDPVVFTTFDTWNGARQKARAAIARGQAYTLRKKGTNETKIVTDPGRALITGRSRRVPASLVRCGK